IAARVYMSRYPVSADEATTIVWFASRSPLDIVTDYTIPNNHILHSLFVHVSRQFFGASELAGRIPALTAGVLLVPVSAWIGWKQFGAGVALVVAAFVAAFPPLLEYSAQARGYTLSALLIALAFLSLLYALEKPTRSAWMLYALCSGLALFAVPTSLMGLYFIGIWLLTRPGRTWAQLWRAAAWTTGAIAFAVLMYLPAAALSGWQRILSNTYVQAIPLRVIPRRLAELALVLRDCWAGALPNWVAAGLLLVSMYAVVRRTGGEHRAARLAIAFVGMCIVVLIVNRTVPPQRSLVVILPLLACVPAVGLHALLQPLTRWHRLALPVVAVALSGAWMVALELRTQSIAAQPNLTRARDGSDQRVHCCSSGYYPDAEDVAVWAKRATSPSAPLVAHAFEGVGEAVRFYLLREQVDITRLHRFDHRAGFAQLAGYDSMFVISRGVPRASEPDAHAASVLRMAVEQVQALFTARAVGRPFLQSALVVLVPRAGMEATIAASGRQIDRLDYPR
ncbi:MAG: hypothetical protein ACREOG_09625, partial [Gemmatimonadaceae bacterium]